ncbi:MAG: hypothetical protein ACLPQS_13965 [Acidimicrobiales bacterium]
MTEDDLTEKVRTALLALEGTVIEDLRLPLPGDLRDISKAAAMVSGVVEDRIPALLNAVRDRTWDENGTLNEYEFRRFTIGFPDVLLVERANPENVLFQIEAKSWYILSADPITARFLTAPSVMTDGTQLVIVAWLLDGIVSGSPKLLRIYADDALNLAEIRDRQWEGIGQDHRVVYPENAAGTPRSLLKTQVRAEMQRADGTWEAESQNFGKLHRLHDDGILAFEETVKSLTAAGKTLQEWQTFIKRGS